MGRVIILPTLVTLGSVQSIETRAYGNSNWLDQLTNINGTAITYDNMGNPLKWHNASSLTWEGRKLKTFKKTDGTVISYTYDENGIRTCRYCGARYRIAYTSSIGLDDDVAELLRKCRENPARARKYANLILDIDPDNPEALKYLK